MPGFLVVRLVLAAARPGLAAFAGDAMPLVEPFAQIDELAALAAEGPEARRRLPAHGLAAGGALDGFGHSEEGSIEYRVWSIEG